MRELGTLDYTRFANFSLHPLEIDYDRLDQAERATAEYPTPQPTGPDQIRPGRPDPAIEGQTGPNHTRPTLPTPHSPRRARPAWAKPDQTTPECTSPNQKTTD